jgi:16S rRNA (uracil1498-N3)-methyltransferase
MRRRFFVDEVRSGRAEISGDDARHLTRVLRVEAGQRYEISDNRNVYLAEIDTARKEHVSFRTIEKLAAPAPTVRLILCAALIKFDHFEWMIEKATELGVSEIIPVETIRSDRGLERAAHKRVERWRRIALESSQQARRAFLPDVSEPESLRETLARDSQDSVAMLIGPEGGWTDDERAQFAAAQWTPVSLGPLILRAETAALAALAIAGSAWLVD